LIAWTNEVSKQMMLAYTTESIFQLRLPASNDPTSSVHIVAHIRDTFGAVTEFHLPSVIVLRDLPTITKLINIFEQSNSLSSNDTLIQLLGDRNAVEQITTSISEIFNEMNSENIEIAGLSKHESAKIIEIIANFYCRWYSYNTYFSNIFE
jgi:hypothetical protein